MPFLVLSHLLRLSPRKSGYGGNAGGKRFCAQLWTLLMNPPRWLRCVFMLHNIPVRTLRLTLSAALLILSGAFPVQCQSTTPPRALSAPLPIPPAKTTKQRKVVISFVVTEQGTTRDITVVKHFKPDFDSAAIDAVRRWTFEPATKDGKPVAIRLETEVTFRPPRP